MLKTQRRSKNYTGNHRIRVPHVWVTFVDGELDKVCMSGEAADHRMDWHLNQHTEGRLSMKTYPVYIMSKKRKI